MNETLNKIRLINDRLKRASIAYYNESREIMSDFEYDKLYDELLELEKQTGIVYSDSVTQNIEFITVNKLEKVSHSEKILSLNKTKVIDELKDFLQNKIGLLSFKLDGLTVVLEYKNGSLVRAITRGNGEIGEDITHNAKVFKKLPLKINYKGDLTIRGEAIISFKEFDEINSKLPLEEKYKNPRNLCSGTVRQLNNEVCSLRKVNFIAFTVVESDEDSHKLKSEQLNWLYNMGFDTVFREVVTVESIEDSVRRFQNKIQSFEFATDGLVLTFDNIEESIKMGKTAKFPKDSLAFKWKDEIMETTLTDVVWNTSRTGLINPVAIFEPVELEGTTVSRASLHNLSILESLELGIGDTITVYKANMIIPQVAENLTKSNTYIIPKNCSVCGSKTDIITTKEGSELRCPNINCQAQILRRLSHFVSRDCMNIEGLSEAILERFIDEGFITDFISIYELENFKDNIENLKGFGEKSYNKLITAIERSKDVHLANFINSLGINNVGLVNSKRLVKHFNNDLNRILNASEEEIISIDGFGKINTDSVIEYFSDDDNVNNVKKLYEYINIIDEKIDGDSLELILENKVFVITGDLERFENRKDLSDQIEKLGGKVTMSISSKTDYLINNNVNSTSSKNKKAKQLGIPIISEHDFIKIINQ